MTSQHNVSDLYSVCYILVRVTSLTLSAAKDSLGAFDRPPPPLEAVSHHVEQRGSVLPSYQSELHFGIVDIVWFC